MMSSSDFTPAFATAAETAEALRKKNISASELTNMTLQRIDRHNPKLNAIVWQDREQAMARAKHADEALATGNASGALCGVPVTIKESFAYNPLYGTTNNPWDLTRTPGGSTGGGAAALAASLGCLTIGTSIEFAALLSDVAGGFTAPPAFRD